MVDFAKEFESGYETEEQEIVVLLKEACNGAGVRGNWLIPSVTFVACIYDDNENVVKEEGRIEWLIKEEDGRQGWGYDFKQYGIYRLRVRKCIPMQLSPMHMAVMDNRYMLVSVLEEDVENDELNEMKEYLMLPVVINTPYGDFELDRSMEWFSVETKLAGHEVSISLETDEDSDETAEGALKTFNIIASDFEGFDVKCKEYSAEELLELANDWLADDDSEDKPDEITKEMFIERMEISELTISPDGCITAYYDDGDLFWGHSIEVEIESDGSCSSADIVG